MRHRGLNILLNPAVNHYLIEQYVYPATKVGPTCGLPINSNCQWVADWATFQAGYLTLPSAWKSNGTDYGVQAAGALSFMTGITVDGYNGQDAYSFYLSSNTNLPEVSSVGAAVVYSADAVSTR